MAGDPFLISLHGNSCHWAMDDQWHVCFTAPSSFILALPSGQEEGAKVAGWMVDGQVGLLPAELRAA